MTENIHGINVEISAKKQYIYFTRNEFVDFLKQISKEQFSKLLTETNKIKKRETLQFLLSDHDDYSDIVSINARTISVKVDPRIAIIQVASTILNAKELKELIPLATDIEMKAYLENCNKGAQVLEAL